MDDDKRILYLERQRLYKAFSDIGQPLQDIPPKEDYLFGIDIADRLYNEIHDDRQIQIDLSDDDSFYIDGFMKDYGIDAGTLTLLRVRICEGFDDYDRLVQIYRLWLLRHAAWELVEPLITVRRRKSRR